MIMTSKRTHRLLLLLCAAAFAVVVTGVAYAYGEQPQSRATTAAARTQSNPEERATRDKVHNINNLNYQIERQELNIEELRTMMEELQDRTDVLIDSVELLHHNDSVLTSHIARNMRKAHALRHRMSPLAFVSSAENVNQAARRINYLYKLQQVQSKKVEELRGERMLIATRQNQLDSVRSNYASSIKKLSTAQNILEARRSESKQAVTDLRKQGVSLNKVLQDKKTKVGNLDGEVSRVIDTKDTQSKANGADSRSSVKSADKERKLTGSFLENKGRLLFPVAGNYRITGTFGRSQYGNLSTVQLDNPGIDIGVSAGTKVRSVFDGEVSSIFYTDDYDNVVMVRHGEYLTVYAGLMTLNVHKGEKVKTGQALGTVTTIGGESNLHFEVRRELNKLNPLHWVK